MSRRQRKELIFGLLALLVVMNAGEHLFDLGARASKVLTFGLGAFAAGAAFRALIHEWRDRKDERN